METFSYTIIFTLGDKVGALDESLAIFKELKVNLTRIESRPSRTYQWDYDFFAEFDTSETIESIIKTFRENKNVKEVRVISSGPPRSKQGVLPWFPRRMIDLDSFATKTLEYGAELSADHPGFTDGEYRKRRAEITEIAKTFKT